VRYTKPIIALISERLISQAEDFCIFLKNAKRCTFVGTPTTGADGTITFISLPGGGQVSFSGEEVRYPDGSPFQRIGVLPDVNVSPTVNGIRAGRDEVLEKGVEVLRALIKQNSTSAKPSPRK
jgi:C-terminal processing protease CtpA/Prc